MDDILQKFMPLGVGDQTALGNHEQATREFHEIPFSQANHRLLRFPASARVNEVLSGGRIGAAQLQYYMEFRQGPFPVRKQLFCDMSPGNIVSKHHLFP